MKARHDSRFIVKKPYTIIYLGTLKHESRQDGHDVDDLAVVPSERRS